MKFWNVHRTTGERLEGLLNRHAQRGWDLSQIRSVGNYDKGNLLVVFVRDFADQAALDAFLQERAARRSPVEEPPR